ncbi:MAG TPA: prephenate dehydratase [Gemmatimonadaceae bacterium]|nr:prephenate dehydratase [Gemmatimonadaceae bacterium]
MTAPTRIAFQGELGAFSEEAIRNIDPHATPVPCREFIDVAQAVESGHADAGMLPIENTLAGSVVGSYDALTACASLHVVAETVVEIHHCVLGVRGAALDALATVESHPVALAQCTRWLRAHPAIIVRAAYDTAGAARDIAARGDARAAAIAGRGAAARYDLDVLAADIEDRSDNQTRFLMVARAPRALMPHTPARTALLITTPNVPGALLRVLEPLAAHAINMSKLESRPADEPWHYRFFLELDHPAGDAALAAALDQLRGATESLRVLGTYSRWLAGRAGSGTPD